MDLPTFGGGCPPDDRGGKERVRSTHVITADDENARLDGNVERGGVGKARKLTHPEVGAQRDGQQQPSHVLRQAIDPQTEEVFDGVGHGNVLPDPRRAVVDELAADLEREQGVPESRVVDSAEQLSRDVQPEAVAQDAADRPDAQRGEIEPLDPARFERLLER